MKRNAVLVLVGLAMAGFFLTGCFTTNTVVSGFSADLNDMPDVKQVPRQNPANKTAEVVLERGGAYALPAAPLKPEAERLPPPVYAISGVKGQEISETTPWEVVDIWVVLPEKEAFAKGLLEGADVNAWIVNLPAGLEARAHALRKGATRVSIYISGTPEKTGREYIKVNIPGDYLRSGQSRQFVSPTEEESASAWAIQQTDYEAQLKGEK